MRFDAPWATMVKVVTVCATGVLGYAAFGVGRRYSYGSAPLWLWFLTSVLPLLLLAGGLLFTVRGYRLEPGRLLVQRLLWSTPVDLAGLRSARHDPEAMRRSLRLLGNGGMFAIAGLFSNRQLGRYRAFATNPKNAVVLDFGERKVVVTPGRPEELVRQLESMGADGSA